MHRVMNFNAGPATLPEPALERAREELLDFAGTGMSVMEHSHRGKEYEAVHDEATSLLRELAGLPATHEVLYLQGGASQHFAQVPLNFLEKGRTAGYVVTGAWGEKAFSEARTIAALGGGTAELAATTGEGEGKEKSYVRVARDGELRVPNDAAYLHFTTNETIHGVQYEAPDGVPFPRADVPLVADMSSDFLWKKTDFKPFSFVYAGAQKNIGPSGLVVAIAEKGFLERGRKDLPKILQYRTVAENKSLYNTPPTFSIYLVRNVLAWARSVGGIEQLEAWNREKASLLYRTIDEGAGFFRCPVERASRSTMNVVFRLPTEALEERFVSAAKKAGMVGLKGHRSVGGIRVSLYNAVPVAWVRSLCDFMGEFVRTNG